jgi:hypothetical protein
VVYLLSTVALVRKTSQLAKNGFRPIIHLTTTKFTPMILKLRIKKQMIIRKKKRRKVKKAKKNNRKNLRKKVSNSANQKKMRA